MFFIVPAPYLMLSECRPERKLDGMLAFVEKPETGTDKWIWPLVLGLSALALRLAHLLTVRDSPFFSYLMLDNLMYDEWGMRIAAGDWLGRGAFFQDPLYAYLLGVEYSLFGHHYLPVLAVQCLLGALVPPLLYLAARRWFGRTAAFIAGAIAALYLPSIYYEGMILKSWMALFLVAVLVWLLSRVDGKESRWLWLWIGLVLGLACLARGNIVLFVPFLAAWSLLRRSWRNVFLLLLGVGVVVGIVSIRNRVAGGEWILTTSNAGQNFYIGNNPLNHTGEYEKLPFIDPNPKHEERGFAVEAERRTGEEMSAKEVSRFWFSEARSWMFAEPGAWARLTWLKLRNYWGAYEIPDNLDYYLYRSWAPVLRLPLPGFGLVAPLGLLGAVLAWRLRGWPRLLVLFVAVYSFSVVLFFVFSRFRMAMMPAIFILAGYGVAELVRRFWRPALVLLVFLFMFVNLPVRGTADSLALRIAGAVGLPTRSESSATAHYNLGLTFAAHAGKNGDSTELLELAEAELRKALEQEPDHARIHVELGKVLARQHRNNEAIEIYMEAARLDPYNHRIHYALGLLYRREGDYEAAARAFRRAKELNPAANVP
jgi:4-amino-4-deoxy-L-arabinose transferase-like glycosyltransferase